MRERIIELLGDHALGRTDTYQAFLFLAIRLLRPGGLGLFVVPHSFMLSETAGPLRAYLTEHCAIRFVADLSGAQVFEGVSAYVMLLIFEKRDGVKGGRPATVVRATEMVGHALQDALAGRHVDTPYYQVFEQDASSFGSEPWRLRSPAEADLGRKVATLPTLGDFFKVRLGFISGADDVFIVPKSLVPKGEGKAFVPFLADRQIGAYAVPKRTDYFFFYPYLGERSLDEAEVADKYPATYAYLKSHEVKLSARSQVRKGNVPWWRPERPRKPSHLMRPKIVTPHLVVVPRFALDEHGTLAVSRAPYLYPLDEEGAELDLMRFYLGILNTTVCFWHIGQTSHRYSRGYAMLEPKTLRGVPVPDIQKVDPMTVASVVQIVERLVQGTEGDGDDESLEDLSASLYGLSHRDRVLLGLAEERR